jgi:Acetyltransferase (GNAT) domain
MRLSIQVLLIDGLPVAGIVCGAFERSVYALHVVYDERWNALAPGSAMLLMGMRQAIDGGCAFFNLMSGFGYYKARWLAQATPTRVGQIYRVGSLLYWRRVFGDMKRRLWPRRETGEALRFNPARRDVETSESGSRDRPPATPEAQARLAALIARARAGPGEFLSGDEFAAVMPIDMRRAVGVKRPRGPPGGLA